MQCHSEGPYHTVLLLHSGHDITRTAKGLGLVGPLQHGDLQDSRNDGDVVLSTDGTLKASQIQHSDTVLGRGVARGTTIDLTQKGGFTWRNNGRR
jgi:hypothetical protein